MKERNKNFLDCLDPVNDIFSPLFPEDRIIFGLHPASFFETTLSHFKKLYNKNDAKLIAKQVFTSQCFSTLVVTINFSCVFLRSSICRPMNLRCLFEFCTILLHHTVVLLEQLVEWSSVT